MDSAAKDNKEIDYQEAITAGGCTRNSHIQLTLGLKPFESRICPKCNLEIYRP